MNNAISTVTNLLAIFTAVADLTIILILTLCLLSLFNRKSDIVNFVFDIIERYSITLSFLVASVSTVSSLFFSEIVDIVPCKLCWYQRIFMYPQVIILLTALITNDSKVKKYIIPLSIMGFLFSAYQYTLQIFPGVLQCSDELISCSKKYTVYFGYITIPMMSATAFLLIILFNLIRQNKDQETK